MTENTPQIQEPTVALPESAPMVRVTAGVGSAGQKTWNLRRPVTLIGSSRPAHIVLHDKDISKAHCVIVNTGTDVLVKDLRTSSGTKCNRNPIDIAVLADGDVLTIGSNNIQVAINLPEGTAEDSGAGLQYADPVKFAQPIDVRLMHTDQQWTIDEAVVLIGRHERATINLDHADVAKRHAVIFRFGDRPAVFDLGGRAGIWVSGKRSLISLLSEGDCLTVGPFGLSIGSPDLAALKNSTGSSGDPILRAVLPSTMGGGTGGPSFESRQEGNGAASSAADANGTAAVEPDTSTPARYEGDGVGLDSVIGDTWQSLNEWKGSSGDHKAEDAKRAEALAAKEAALDARDAELRGRLHDVTRMHEQVVEREKQMARLQAELDESTKRLDEERERIAQLETEFQQRQVEVQSRENALAQRWSRIRSAKCVHCGKPISLTQSPGA